MPGLALYEVAAGFGWPFFSGLRRKPPCVIWGRKLHVTSNCLTKRQAYQQKEQGGEGQIGQKALESAGG